MSILISLLVFALIAYLAFWILGQIPMPQPIRVIVTAIIGIILLLALLSHGGISI